MSRTIKVIFTSSLLVLSTLSFADVSEWQRHMTKLSQVLADAFPFLYSGHEFKDPKNKKAILKHLETLAQMTHSLPANAGKDLIGADPLIDNVQLNTKADLQEAVRLYKSKGFANSQRTIHESIQKCFACHIAHQVGPQFPTTNQEVMGMATSYTLGKAIVFGALRQYNGTLEFIEKQAYSKIDKENPTQDDLVKTYFVVALRGTSNFSRAANFVTRLQKDAKPNASAQLSQWSKDIETWGKLASTQDRAQTRNDLADKNNTSFIAQLFQTHLLHARLSTPEKPEFQREVYGELGRAYAALNYAPLSALAKVYFGACGSGCKSRPANF